ncbi:hypothetical protein CI102_10061 [Trichoderma harzianum]|nr:hypothetical protein CI102_10061 [Trichoderma harzianum]
MRGAQEYAGDLDLDDSLFFNSLFFFFYPQRFPGGPTNTKRHGMATMGGRYTCWLAFGYQLGVIGLGIYREHESILCYSGSGGTRTTAAQL